MAYVFRRPTDKELKKMDEINEKLKEKQKEINDLLDE